MPCAHTEDLPASVEPDPPDGCGPCMAVGDTWVHLRLCLTCGAVRCCDSSPNKHATEHFHETDHPVMRSFQPGESWRWCFVDQQVV
jgi:uncharacterized UBP type Zn finger protein